MSLSDIFNFIEIDDLVATAGQPSEAQFREARAEGYQVVINLAPDGLESSLPGESELLASLGIDYHHIPVAWDEPQLERFEALLETSAGRRTLIHCQANYRVTAFFALYAQARQGRSEAQADALINRIWASRPGYRMDDTWKNFIVAARQRPAR